MNTRQRGRWGLALALVATAGGVAAWALVSGEPALRLWGTRDVGSSAGELETLGVYGEVPDFRLTERSGRRVGRPDLRYARHCAACHGPEGEGRVRGNATRLIWDETRSEGPNAP